MITYRTPTVEDAEQIVDFYNRMGGETSFLSFEENEYPVSVSQQKDSIKFLENNATNMMLLAVDGEEIAGIITISSSHKIKSRHDGVLGIVVAQKYQGQGVGTNLIKQAVAWARGNGITRRLSLDTRADNISAVNLYLKSGFEFEGCRKNATLLNGIYYDTYVMGMML